MGSAKWKRFSDPRVMIQAGVSLPKDPEVKYGRKPSRSSSEENLRRGLLKVEENNRQQAIASWERQMQKSIGAINPSLEKATRFMSNFGGPSMDDFDRFARFSGEGDKP